MASLAATATAADQVLKLKNGDLVPGTVVTIGADAVVFDRSAGGRLTVNWDRIYPISRYELTKSSLGDTDAEGRVKLAEWSVAADLFLQARREITQARGLGYDGPVDLGKMLKAVHKEEADHTLREVDALVDAGEFDKALRRITRYVRVADDEDQEARVRSRVPDIVTRIERRDATDRETRAQGKKDARAARKAKWVKAQLTGAAAKKAKAAERAIDAFAWLSKGNQTRARKNLGSAEKDYVASRDTFKRVRRAVGSGDSEGTGEFAKRQMDEIDRRLLEIYLRWGALEVGNKSWKRASPVVDRGLRIDPVHEELQSLRRTIDENWIRRKLSDITGARGRQSN